ncbi:hypothetical protein FPQ18DRAFT_374827 [Pyronema domesticum]|nr:hypothetical protein FPQ18DRAFT_374827 [Pyronema domesticum]
MTVIYTFEPRISRLSHRAVQFTDHFGFLQTKRSKGISSRSSCLYRTVRSQFRRKTCLRRRRILYMHPTQLGVDVSGPPLHTGQEDPDFGVKPAPRDTKFPSQKACLDLCKPPTDGSVKWNELEPADVLRAVCKFHLRFPRACWEQAEDYIFEKFGKIGSEGTRGGKIQENRVADAKGVPAPHKIRHCSSQRGCFGFPEIYL